MLAIADSGARNFLPKSIGSYLSMVRGPKGGAIDRRFGGSRSERRHRATTRFTTEASATVGPPRPKSARSIRRNRKSNFLKTCPGRRTPNLLKRKGILRGCIRATRWRRRRLSRDYLFYITRQVQRVAFETFGPRVRGCENKNPNMGWREGHRPARERTAAPIPRRDLRIPTPDQSMGSM